MISAPSVASSRAKPSITARTSGSRTKAGSSSQRPIRRPLSSVGVWTLAATAPDSSTESSKRRSRAERAMGPTIQVAFGPR